MCLPVCRETKNNIMKAYLFSAGCARCPLDLLALVLVSTTGRGGGVFSSYTETKRSRISEAGRERLFLLRTRASCFVCSIDVLLFTEI